MPVLSTVEAQLFFHKQKVVKEAKKQAANYEPAEVSVSVSHKRVP